VARETDVCTLQASTITVLIITVTCWVLRWLTDGVSDSMTRYIARYTFTQLGTTGNYSAIADLHNLQFTATQALGFSVFTNLIQATIYNSLTITSYYTRSLLCAS
jgi:hypothetical protein